MSADAGFELLAGAGRARSRDELAFFAVNRSVACVRYDRATLWRVGRRPTPLATSGAEPIDPRAAYAADWSRRIAGLPGGQRSAVFPPQQKGGGAALWVPAEGAGIGVVFERLAGDAFSDAEVSALGKLIAGYGAIWRGLGANRSAGGGKGRWFRLAAAAAVVLALVFVRVPLRVVAPCEVTARTPILVAAPMDGVIREVLAPPGGRVEAGDPLAEYDSRLMEEELNIAARQVGVAEAELAAARARSFSEPKYRGEATLLEARLEQERARRDALDIRYSRRTIVAPSAGVVQLDDARAWRGRPVSTGQGVLWIVDPGDTRATLWLPQDDRIDVDPSRPVEIHLFARGGEGIPARLTYISSFASPSPDGVYAFPAEADWTDPAATPPVGLRGVAAVYGEKVRLGYWLFRRPLAWLRRWLGV